MNARGRQEVETWHETLNIALDDQAKSKIPRPVERTARMDTTSRQEVETWHCVWPIDASK